MSEIRPPVNHKELMAAIFGSNDPKKWNNGVWPPPSLRSRWRELFTAALRETADSTMDAQDIVERAVDIADRALRVEVERGF